MTGSASQQCDSMMEVDEDINIENGEGTSLHDGDVRARPHSQAEEPDDRTGHSTVWNVGKSHIEENVIPCNQRSITPQPQVRCVEEDDGWEEVEQFNQYGACITVILPRTGRSQSEDQWERVQDSSYRALNTARTASTAASKAAEQATKSAQAAIHESKRGHNRSGTGGEGSNQRDRSVSGRNELPRQRGSLEKTKASARGGPPNKK
jgi:hypothetical protein